ncbi:alpha-elapitoxin-Al2b-like [Melanotaenia boesemani]|uniref:alpha-elapitoxin-Al2b-like n=1 Tax=Melanotaenia boesemani TaxID=1250792 RepID=UPI001C050EE6|nr:alpha-elapitoxin-Al2b-like [Melanotaenia boesemani]
MGKVLFAIVASVASLILVESLTCNKCNFGLLGICLNQGTETCTTNTSICYTGKATFPNVTSFSGFNSQGCTTSTAGCNTTTSSSLLGINYQSTITCCSTDKCNPVTISGAPSAKMTLSATIGAAILASVWGSMLQ